MRSRMENGWRGPKLTMGPKEHAPRVPATGSILELWSRAMSGPRICPYCRKLNSADDERCFHCGRSFPGALRGGIAQLVASVVGSDFPVAKFFLGLCFAVFALCVIEARGMPPVLPMLIEPDPETSARWSRAIVRWGLLVTGLIDQQPWRLLSAMFVHLGVLHLLLNMMTFVDLGRTTEIRVGSWRSAVIFVVTGVLGFVTSELWYSFGVGTAGASGGLFGLGGAQVGALYARRDPAYKDVLLRIVVYAVVFALVMPVNNSAHAGGLVSGALLGFALEKQKQPRRADRLFAVLGALLIALSVASVALSRAFPLKGVEM
jgi:rhomboid protease GluP